MLLALVILMEVPTVLVAVAAVAAQWGLQVVALAAVLAVQVCRRLYQAQVPRTLAVAVAADLVAFPVVLVVLVVVARKIQMAV